MVANHTKGNMTQALADIITGLQTIEEIMNEVSILDNQAQIVRNTVIRPLSQLRTITSEIEGTAVSDAAVQDIFNRADRTLQMAVQSINVTETAACVSNF